MLGGLFGDRFGAKTVIWFSILGVLPFTLALPYADLFWTNILAVVIGLILSSAFSAIVVFAQELVPGRVGMIAGIFFGLAFGVGGIGAARARRRRRPQGHRLRLLGLLVPAAARAADHLPAGHEGGAAEFALSDRDQRPAIGE